MPIIDNPYDWLANSTNGPWTFESPDRGKTVRSRPSIDHPIALLTNGKLPIDVWYKIYGNKNG